jgi:hypothetical protein
MTTDTITLGSVTYERHPYSAIFPLMSTEDYALLLTSMRQLGQRVSIKLLSDTSVFDGWNRLRACVELNLEPTFEHISEDQDLQALTIALNMAHRHLTAGQKGLIAGQLATMTHGGGRKGAGRPAESTPMDETHADLNNQDPKLDLDSFEPSASHALVTSETSEVHTGAELPESNTIKAAAERMGISRATAAMGKRVAEDGDTSLIDAVKSGDLSLAEGYAIAKSPREEHRERVENALANGKEWLKSHKKPRELAEKISRSVLKGDALPSGLTDARMASVFLYVADAIVVGTLAGANCLDAHAQHFTDSHITQFAATHKRFGEALARRTSSAGEA